MCATSPSQGPSLWVTNISNYSTLVRVESVACKKRHIVAGIPTNRAVVAEMVGFAGTLSPTIGATASVAKRDTGMGLLNFSGS